VNPERYIHIYKNTVGTALYPHSSPHEREFSIGSKVSFDCTWPVDWHKINDVPTVVSFKNVYPQEIQDRVTSNWEAYGYPSDK
jgi:4-hydroxy-3-polyprenylbenzoate decarboxylase